MVDGRRLKRGRRRVETTRMNVEAGSPEVATRRLPLWVYGMLFVAYLVAHVVVLLFLYTWWPSAPFVVAELLAIAAGIVVARVTLVAWRRQQERAVKR
jgi:hypothetical protein